MLPISPCHEGVVLQYDIRCTLAYNNMINPGPAAIIEGNQDIVHYPILQDGSPLISGLGIIPEGECALKSPQRRYWEAGT
jgi:hypothetical protein